MAVHHKGVERVSVKRIAGVFGTVALAAVGVLAAMAVSGAAQQSPEPDNAIFCGQFVPHVRASNLYKTWSKQNPKERDTWLGYAGAICLGQNPAPPTLATQFGKALVDAGAMGIAEQGTPPPPTTTTETTTTTAPPTTTTETTTTQPPSSQTGCFSSPGRCGYPDPAYGNVGVPAGTQLTSSGSITVTTPGAVIDGLDVTGYITISANNVMIKNTRVTANGGGCGTSSTCGNANIRLSGNYTATISHVELTTDSGTTVEHGIRNSYGGTINVDHVYQHGNVDALCWCGNANLRDNYSIIHLAIANDHLENLYLDDHTLTATHNTFLNNQPQTANVFGNTNNGSGGSCSNHLTVSDNLLAGGGYSIYPCGNASQAGSSVVTITGNRFARCGSTEVQGGGGTWFCPGGSNANGYFPRAGSFGAEAYYFGNQTWRGNYWDDNLQTFCPDRNFGCA